MADWPELAELKQVLDVASDDWDTTLDKVLASAIRAVKSDVGNWDDDVDEPDESMSAAALRMAELMAQRPEAAESSRNDPSYARHMKGKHRVFGVG
jgi:hypothetical protein